MSNNFDHHVATKDRGLAMGTQTVPYATWLGALGASIRHSITCEASSRMQSDHEPIGPVMRINGLWWAEKSRPREEER